jgi:hypothetical protein
MNMNEKPSRNVKAAAAAGERTPGSVTAVTWITSLWRI